MNFFQTLLTDSWEFTIAAKKRTAGLKDIAMERRKRMGLVFVIFHPF